jgi:hypothetical protein
MGIDYASICDLDKEKILAHRCDECKNQFDIDEPAPVGYLAVVAAPLSKKG